LNNINSKTDIPPDKHESTSENREFVQVLEGLLLPESIQDTPSDRTHTFAGMSHTDLDQHKRGPLRVHTDHGGGLLDGRVHTDRYHRTHTCRLVSALSDRLIQMHLSDLFLG
jgi:hypothetical protein